VTMFGCVGADGAGAQLLENLKEQGVNTQFIKVCQGVPTGIASITVAENDNTIIVVAGANHKVDEDYVEEISKELLDYDMVVLQHEIPLTTVKKVMEFCYQNQIDVILNPAPAFPLDLEMIEKATYITPNEHEAKIIFGDQSREEMLKKYPEKLIITLGAKGVTTCLKSGEILTVPVRPAKVVDTTGAGDTLNGAFAFIKSRGVTMEEALRFANTAASLSTEKFGAQGGMPTFDEVTNGLKEI
ncbi:MAG TPA: ribokinase, partial [Candidatus Merdenecus merdavium]|nr:ribokinase [Candidatus Merdenecus merdavium]